MNIKNYIINMKKPLSRFLARILDYSLFYSFFILPLFFASLFDHDLTHAIAIVLIPLFWIPFETLFVALFGTTPGKAVFGIQIRDAKERKLPLLLSFKRAVYIWLKGMGLNIPLLNIGCGAYRFHEIKKIGRTSLDQKLNVHMYYKKRRSLGTILGSIMVAIFSLFFIAEYEVREVVTSSDQTFFAKKSQSNPNWTSYHDPEGAYSIQFPGAPEAKATHFAIPNSKDKLPFHDIKFFLDQENIEYSLNYTTLPKGWLKWKSSLLLKGSLKVLNSHLYQGKILKKTVKNYSKYPALEFVLMKKNNLQCSGRLVLVGNVLYKIDMTYPAELHEEVQEQLNSFLESFDLK